MSSQLSTRQVYDEGIFHNLPTHSDDIQGLTAIITGANGISGHHLLEVLGRYPKRWSKIYCLSRRPPAFKELPATAEHIAVDFLESPEYISKVLEANNVRGDYVFFFSYVQVYPKENGAHLWSDAEEMCRINGSLLQNFVDALAIRNIKPKRFLLQTGAKYYGSHTGPLKVPQEEWDPRVTLEPNFYYTQEDILLEYYKRTSVPWTIAMPAAILGAVPDAAMNLLFPLAIYATVCSYLKQPLLFPGDRIAFQNPMSHSSAILNAKFEEWAVLHDQTKNERLNICDCSSFTYESLWPKIAGWYGMDWEVPSEEGLTEVEWGYHPPPRGYGPKGILRYKFSLVQWAHREDVQKAWTEIAAKHGLVYKEIHDIERNFGFLDWALWQSEPFVMSMDKSRKLGWSGFTDTTESILDVFDGFSALKMIPPVPKVNVKFC